MNLGGDMSRVVQRAAADEPQARATVFAEDGDLAARTTEDRLRATVVPRRIDGLGCSREQLDTLRLDEQIDDEGAAGLTLTVQTMATVNEQRLRR
jgi:hypothetical protein